MANSIPRTIALFLGFAAVLGSAACAGGTSSLERLHAQPAEEFRGHYTVGTGGSWFRPCGSAAADSAWWVTVTDVAVTQLADARRAGRLETDRPAFVHWRAVLTLGGEVGPRGPGVPALLVRDIISVGTAAPAGCPAP